MIFIGVDPGLTGAIAMVCRDREAMLGLEDLPIIRDGKLAWIDGAVLLGRLIAWRNNTDTGGFHLAGAWVERQQSMPKQSSSSGFTCGSAFGSLMSVLQIHGCPIHLVAPTTWKKALGLSKDKNASLDKARLLYPDASLDRKKDHNRAEALLIAHYGMTHGATGNR